MGDRVLLMYPPGKMFMRGEDRCQFDVSATTAASMRACNDLGYCAAVLREKDYVPIVRDYQTQLQSFDDILDDLKNHTPSVIMLSITNGTIFTDIEVVNEIKKHTDAKIVLKGALFYDIEDSVLASLDLKNVDYLIGGEAETCIGGIVDYAVHKKGDITAVNNILYRDDTGNFAKTRFHVWYEDLDSIPFPARDLMKNELYMRPDTEKPMATIQTSRGCSASCIFCLSPCISGKKIRHRSAENIMAELSDCYYNHNISEFFFKADTFTMDQNRVKELCELIIASSLHGKIHFTANSRVRPLTKETLVLMKKAGCFAIAFGFESGSEKILKKMKKGTTPQDNRNACRWAKEAGLLVYGYYIIGVPWETWEDVKQTEKLIFDTQPDFLEVYIAQPQYGTAFYDACIEEGTLASTTDVVGTDLYNAAITGTHTIPVKDLLAYRDKLILKYYLRPRYIIRRLGDCVKNPRIFLNYAHYGFNIVANTLFKKRIEKQA